MNNKNVVNVDGFDKRAFARAAETNTILKDVLKDGKKKAEGLAALKDAFFDLMEDGYGMFYKYKPKIKPEEDIPFDRLLNKNLLSQLEQTNEYKNLRVYTKGDEVNSAASMTLLKDTLDELPEDVQQAHEDLLHAQEQLDNALEDGGNLSKADMQTLKEAAQQAEHAFQQAYEQAADGIRQSLKIGMREMTKNAEDLDNAVKALGYGDESGVLPNVPANGKIKIAKWLQSNPKLKEIMKLAGNFINIAERKQHQKITRAPQEIEGIELGNELTRLLPSEFLKLAVPELEPLFLKEYSEKALQQYELKAVENVGKGPIVVAIDCSGSMHGQPDTWAKAVALAMWMIARKQKREFGVFLFNNQVVQSVFGGCDKADMLQLLSFGASGGTNFENALKFAWKECLAVLGASERTDADLIFITDGICNIGPEFEKWFNEKKRENKFNVISVCIGASNDWATNIFDKFSDHVFYLYGDLLGNQGAVFDKTFTI